MMNAQGCSDCPDDGLVVFTFANQINMSEAQAKAASPEKDEKDSREPRAEFQPGEDERDPEEVRFHSEFRSAHDSHSSLRLNSSRSSSAKKEN